ncbi:MAG: HTTM domain-containing protein [Bdellovibrionota bacterium]
MMSYKTFLNRWDRFFFKPQPVEGIAVFRIVWCLLLLAYLFLDIGNITDFYGPKALLSLNTVKSQFNYPHMNLFHLFGDSVPVVMGMMWIYGIALFCGMIGFKTRFSLVIALVCMVSFHQRNIWLLSSSEVLMRTIMILLVCAPAGNALSVDSLIGRFKLNPLPRDWAPWALRLIQIQISVVYLWTVWHKLKGDHWIDGTAVYYATRLHNMTNFPVPVLLDNMFTIKLMTWGTLILEFAMGTLIWFKEFRKPLIVAGIFFHLGIEYMMSIPFFEIVMIVLLINFVTPQEMRSFVSSYILKVKEGIRSSTIADDLKGRILILLS